MSKEHYARQIILENKKSTLSHGTRIIFILTGQNGMVERHCMKLENGDISNDCYYVRLDDGRLVIINETYLKII